MLKKKKRILPRVFVDSIKGLDFMEVIKRKSYFVQPVIFLSFPFRHVGIVTEMHKHQQQLESSVDGLSHVPSRRHTPAN